MMERKFTAFKLLFLCMIVVSFSAAGQTIVYVDQAATGADDGTSWANAFTDIQSAIDEAALSATQSTPNQVWVKAGTYYPTSTMDVAISISLKNNVELIGGFAGTESTISQRDFRAHITTLSGNIGNSVDSLDNSDVIISVASDIADRVLIDGFHLEGAYGTAIQSGAIYYASAPTALEIYNCTFKNNYGLLGSAISGSNGSSSSVLEVINCFFIQNGSNIGSVTGAVFVKADAAISNSVFAKNESNNGSGVNIFQASAEITNCTFYDNEAVIGSGVTLDQTTSGTIINCIFWGNTGQPIKATNSGVLNISDNLIEGGFSGSINTIDSDPLFMDENNLDLGIKHCSPAVDQGVSTSWTEDILGNTRTFNGITDLGAIENQVTPLFFPAVEIQNVLCNGEATGQISVNGGGGTGLIEYSIDGVNFSSNSIFSGLGAGTYAITIRDTGNGCEYSESFMVAEPDLLTFSSSWSDVTCNGDADGTVIIFPSGGSTPYQISLDGGNSFVPTQFTTTFQVQNLGPGMLDLLLVDANGCTANSTLTIAEPDAIAGSVSVTDASCNGGSDGAVTVSASGGSGALQYSLSNFVSDNQSSPVFDDLSAGNYTVAIRDASLCQIDVSFTVSEPSSLTLVESFTADVSCNGGDDGSFQYDGSGGTAPYTYSLDGTNFQMSALWEDLVEGSYTVTVKDANECVASTSVVIDEPTSVSAAIATTATSMCGATDGSLVVTAQGGTVPYVYQIDGSPFVGSNTFTGLGADTYEVRVMDDNGCEVLVMGTVIDPGLAAVSVSSTSVACNGDSSGSLEVTTSGGTGPFTYILDGGTPQSTGTFSGLPAGTYSIEVQESNGCSQTVSAIITEPIALGLSVSTTDLSCFQDGTGTIDVVASGGSGLYDYSLDGIDFQSGNQFAGLSAGNYTIYLRDENNCEMTGMAVINEPSELAATTSVVNATCEDDTDGSIGVAVTGGTAPYEFNLDGGAFQASPDFVDLEAGSYSITVRDANGCETQFPETVANQFTVIATSAIMDPLCNGDATGEVTLSASGGTSPYEYRISGSNVQTSPVFGGAICRYLRVYHR